MPAFDKNLTVSVEDASIALPGLPVYMRVGEKQAFMDFNVSSELIK
jgi:hypothetical protein